MSQWSRIHHTSANRELARTLPPAHGSERPTYRRNEGRSLALNLLGYFVAICAIGWLAVTLADMIAPGNSEVYQPVAQVPVPASTVAPSTYVEYDEGEVAGEANLSEDYWGADTATRVPPERDPLVRPHY